MSAYPVFVGAYASNWEENRHLFKQVFALVVSPETGRRRILSRPDSVNDFGKHPGDLAEIVKGHAESKKFWLSKDAVIIDAERPIAEVADEILRLLKLPAAAA